MRFKNPNKKDDILKDLLIEKGIITEVEFKNKKKERHGSSKEK